MYSPEVFYEEYSPLLLINKKNQFFLQKRGDDKEYFKGFWSFFGGRVQEEGAEFSIKEQARVQLGVELQRPQYILTSIYQHGDRLVKLYLFIQQVPDDIVLQLGDGFDGEWISTSVLSSLNIMEQDKSLILYALKWLSAYRERHVTAILLYDEERRYLLQKRAESRSFLPGYWCMFGGGTEWNETALEGVKREAKEELDVDLQYPRLVIETTYQHDALKVHLSIFAELFVDKQNLRLLEGQDQKYEFGVFVDKQNLRLLEGADWGWFSIKEMNQLKMLSHDRDLILYVDSWIRSQEDVVC